MINNDNKYLKKIILILFAARNGDFVESAKFKPEIANPP